MRVLEAVRQYEGDDSLNLCPGLFMYTSAGSRDGHSPRPRAFPPDRRQLRRFDGETTRSGVTRSTNKTLRPARQAGWGALVAEISQEIRV